jgi:hypothetical protein
MGRVCSMNGGEARRKETTMKTLDLREVGCDGKD